MPEPMGHYAHADRAYVQRDREGRRCEGNNRRCTQRAIEQHLVRRVDSDSAENEIKQTCGRHRQQFINNAMWIYISTSRMGGISWQQAS